MPHAFIVPGLRHPARFYVPFARAFSRRGFRPTIIHPTWDHHVMSDYVQEVEARLPATTQSDVMLGFSLGAYITFVLGQRHSFRQQFLCSTSPYFNELLPIIPRSWKRYAGKNRLRDYGKYQWKTIARHNNNRTIFFCGEKEGDIMTNFSKSLASRLRGPLFLIPQNDHAIQHPEYQRAVIQHINKL